MTGQRHNFASYGTFKVLYVMKMFLMRSREKRNNITQKINERVTYKGRLIFRFSEVVHFEKALRSKAVSPDLRRSLNNSLYPLSVCHAIHQPITRPCRRVIAISLSPLSFSCHFSAVKILQPIKLHFHSHCLLSRRRCASDGGHQTHPTPQGDLGISSSIILLFIKIKMIRPSCCYNNSELQGLHITQSLNSNNKCVPYLSLDFFHFICRIKTFSGKTVKHF